MNKNLIYSLIVLLTAISAPTFAQDIRFAPGIKVTAKVTVISVVLTTDATGVFQPPEGVTLDRTQPVTILSLTPGPFTPITPITPVPHDPSLTLTEALKKSLDAIPNYPQKQTDRQVLAFSLDFLSKPIPNNGNKSEAFALLKNACDQALGVNSPKWGSWWATINQRTVGSTNSQVKSHIAEIVASLTDGLPVSNGEATYSGGDMGGGPSEETINEFLKMTGSYGIDRERLQQIIKLLLPFLLQILQHLF